MATVCSDCGLSYVAESPDDARYHRRFHAESGSGLRRPASATDETIWSEGARAILAVNADSHETQRRRASALSLVASRDVPFSFVAYNYQELRDDRDLHLFLGRVGERLVAYLAFARRRHIWSCSWAQWDAHETPPPAKHDYLWTVELLWVCRSQRRRGWSSKLVVEATNFLGVAEFAWHPPFTGSGEAAARAICPAGLYIGK